MECLMFQVSTINIVWNYNLGNIYKNKKINKTIRVKSLRLK